MIAGADLAAWLNNRARQKHSRDLARKTAQSWAAHPIVSWLQGELDTMPVQNAQSVMAAAEGFMACRDDIETLITQLVESASAELFFSPPFFTVTSDIHSGLLLFEHPSLSIAIGVTGADELAAKKSGKRGPTSIGFTGYLTRFKFLKAGGATLSFWEAPRIEGSFLSEEGGRCRFVERRTIEDGESIVMDGRYQSFVIEHATSDIVNIQAVVRAEAAPLAVQYDSKTLDYVGASSTDEASSRTQMMATLLRVMERDDAADVVAGQLESPHFYTRWHIMRELLAMDSEIALPKLREMAESDPHPQVRAAAKHTLNRLFGPIEEAA